MNRQNKGRASGRPSYTVNTMAARCLASSQSNTSWTFSASVFRVRSFGSQDWLVSRLQAFCIETRRLLFSFQVRHVLTAIRYNHDENLAWLRKLLICWNALIKVSCARSSESSSEPVIRNVSA